VKKRPLSEEVRDCAACGVEALEDRYTPILSGDTKSPTLFIKMVASEEEAAHGRLWSDYCGKRFSTLMQDEFMPISEVCTTVLVRCPFDKVGVRHVRNCRTFFDRGVLSRDWRYVVCLGRDVMRHVFLRGGAPPSEDAFKGRLVAAPDNIVLGQVGLLPNPSTLMLSGPEDTDEYLQGRYEEMRSCLAALRKLIGGSYE